MKDQTVQIEKFLHRLVEPQVIIFSIALFQFISILMFIMQYKREFPVPSDHWKPLMIAREPFLVLFASLMLLIGGSWKYLLAIVSSLWVIYQLGYLGLLSVSAAHDKPLFSFYVPSTWLRIIYQTQPQYLLQIVLATIILLYASILFSRGLTRGRA